MKKYNEEHGKSARELFGFLEMLVCLDDTAVFFNHCWFQSIAPIRSNEGCQGLGYWFAQIVEYFHYLMIRISRPASNERRTEEEEEAHGAPSQERLPAVIIKSHDICVGT